MRILEIWNFLLWQRALPVLLTVTAAVCAMLQKGVPVRGFRHVLRETYGALLRRGSTPKQRRIFASALAATMGTGNLVGTALAVMTGGAGAVFWMWVSALVGMVLVYAENVLGIRYRHEGAGGALGYLRYGLKNRALTAFFAACCTISALGMGNMAQSSTIAQTVRRCGISPPAAGLLTAAALAVIVCGGRRRIGGAAVWLMPLICGFYLLGCAVLLVRHYDAIPDAFGRILREAFGLRQAGCGISAAVMMRSLSIGLRRGIFSNEAGLGSSALLHSDADTDADTQGKWAAAEVFADTVICCTLTALVILTAPDLPMMCAGDAAGLLLRAFSSGLGDLAGGFLGICMILLAFATMIGWYPCGAACAEYLLGKRAGAMFSIAYLLAAFAGALGSPEWIWAFCDCANGMMALPNLYALLRLPVSCEND